MRNRNNENWVKAIQDGDFQALIELGEFLVKVAYNYLINRSDLDLATVEVEQIAHDCAQSSMETIIKMINTFSFRGSFVGWARKIVYNEARNWMRRWRRERNVATSLPSDNLSNKDFENIELEEIVNSINQISASCLTERECLVLEARYKRDLPFKEIANMVGTTENNASKIHRRAIQKIRQELREAGFDRSVKSERRREIPNEHHLG